MANPRFPSKVDAWLAAILVLLLVTAFAVPILLFATGEPQAWVGLVGTAVILAILGGLAWPVCYELEDEALLIRFGLVRSRIRYAAIRRVVPSRSILSSPALSMDRLHVDAGSSLGPLISPRDKAGFLDALGARAPQLVRQGDSLVPRS